MTGALNAAPVVDAGPDQTVTLPASGCWSGRRPTTAARARRSRREWSQVSGPGVAVFGDAGRRRHDGRLHGARHLRPATHAPSDGELSATDDVTDRGGRRGQSGARRSRPGRTRRSRCRPTWRRCPGRRPTTGCRRIAHDGVEQGQRAGHGDVRQRGGVGDDRDVLDARAPTCCSSARRTALLSGSDTVTVTVNADPANKAIDFGGTNAFVTLGPAPGLGASRFTIETWFRRDGAGIATFTGTGGVTAIPLVTKGMAEVDDGNNRDMNYFLGIRQSDGVLVADFEDTATGGNHPVAGITPIRRGPAWHHAAVTYDGTTWRLYLDGQLERRAGRRGLHAALRQHSARGARHGAQFDRRRAAAQPQGFFNGVLDEARIWNYARSADADQPRPAARDRDCRRRDCSDGGA